MSEMIEILNWIGIGRGKGIDIERGRGRGRGRGAKRWGQKLWGNQITSCS